jgi:lysophospholipase L1-like esterase
MQWTNRTNVTTIFAGDSIMRSLSVSPNYAIGGDTTANFLQHWDEIRRTFPRASTVIVHIGLNDLRLGASPFCTFGAIQRVSAHVRSTGVRAIFMEVIDADVPSRSRELNRHIRSHSVWSAPWSLNRSMYRKDNIHPNPEGVLHLHRQLSSLVLVNDSNVLCRAPRSTSESRSVRC